jgi:hypothetical protein
MTARLFHCVPEHLLNGRFDPTTDALSVILLTSEIDEGTLLADGPQSLTNSLWIDEWTAYIPTVADNAVDIGATMVRYYELTQVHGDVTEATLPYPGTDTGYGVLIFNDTGTPTTSPVFIIDVFDMPIGLSAADTFVYQLPVDGVFDMTIGVV